MPRKRKTLKLNGLGIEITKENVVIITDKMSNCDEAEATVICSYLFQEGFLKEGSEVVCEIVQP